MKRLALLALLLAACDGAMPPPKDWKPAPAPAATCVDPMKDGLARVESHQRGREDYSPPIPADWKADPAELTDDTRNVLDLDGDGAKDRVLQYLGLRLLYLVKPGCARWVGTVDTGLDGMISASSESHGGMHDLFVEQWLMHGDRKSETWIYAGSSYFPSGDEHEIPGPRPPH